MVRPQNLPPDRSGDTRHHHVSGWEVHWRGAEDEEQYDNEDPGVSLGGDPDGGWPRIRSEFEGGDQGDRFIHPAVAEAAGGHAKLAEMVVVVGRVIEGVYANPGVSSDTEIGGIFSFGPAKHAEIFIGEPGKLELNPAAITKTLHLDDFDRGWIFFHCHPTRPAQPSNADHVATFLLAWMGKMTGRELVDHWIFSMDGSFYSYRTDWAEALRPGIEFLV